MWTIHKSCSFCGKIGHKKDMIKKYFHSRLPDMMGWYCYFHEECFKKRFNVKKCPCGDGWIKDNTQESEGE